MSIKEMSRVWSDSKQKGNSLLLLLALADNANDAGYCFPGIEYLAHKTRMSERTVLRMIEDLERAGEIAVDHRRTKGNRYMILSGCIDAEKDTRIAKLSDNASPVTAKLSHITDTIMGKVPTTVNQPSIESTAVRSVFVVWEQEAKLPLSPMLNELMTDAENEYTEPWVIDAIKEAVKVAGVGNFNWVYVEAILKRWKKEGRESKRTNGNDQKPTQPPTRKPARIYR